jgi:nucleoside-diphosphate-sugar epimerase
VEGNACEVDRFIANINKARNHIDFKPSIKLEEGVRALVESNIFEELKVTKEEVDEVVEKYRE